MILKCCIIINIVIINIDCGSDNDVNCGFNSFVSLDLV